MRSRHAAFALLAAALLVLPLSACSGGPFPGSGGGASAREDSAVTAQKSVPDLGSTADGGEADGSAEGASAGKSIISTGEISIVVDDPSDAAERAAEVVKDLKGSVESQNIMSAMDGEAESASLVLRVPADQLDEAFAALGQIGEVSSQSRSATDVTAEHVDLKARVAALETSVKRLSDLMAGAASTSELLEAESALSARQQELDGLTAQLDALEGQVADATISVSLSTETTLPGGGPANFWEGLLAGLSSMAAAGAGALVLIGILLPWLALCAIVAFAIVLIVQAARRRRARRAPEAE